MTITTILKRALIALSLLPIGAAAVPFDKLYVFGDSLSDQGNDWTLTAGAVPPAEYSDGTTYGRFTNGRNYIDYLADSLGLSSAPSLLGGTNYAYGGARTSYQAPTSPFALSLLQQRDAYLSDLGGGPADPNGLYVVWAGSNNLSDILGRLSTDPLYDPTADLTATAADLGNVVASLAAVGARNVLVANVPDLGLVPAVTGGGAPNGLVSGLVMNFNLGLSGVLDQVDLGFPDLNLHRLDAFGLLDGVYADPYRYGLSNVTDACYSLYVQPGGSTCGNPGGYLFWDAEHPSSTTHRILAVDARRAVPAPPVTMLLALGFTALAVAGRRRSASAAG